jgi:hypothetical protein
MSASEYVLNDIVLGDDWAAVQERFGTTEAGSDIAIYVIGTFVLGIVLVWLYAAMRPRFGAGVKTAVTAGFVGWLLVYGMWWWFNLASEMLPRSLVTTSAIWGFFELAIATSVGAWLYKED